MRGAHVKVWLSKSHNCWYAAVKVSPDVSLVDDGADGEVADS